MKRSKYLYIHIPFCGSICWFCDFKRTKNSNAIVQHEYVLKIIAQIRGECEFKQFKTIYLGGGTPNFLNTNSLSFLLAALKPYLADDAEFSIECNPEFLDQSQIDLFIKFGINRISLGAQSLNDKILKSMHRVHDSKQIIKAIELLKANHFANYSCDFIYNYPNSTLADLKEIFNFIKKYQIPHISFYALEIKSNSIINKLNYQIDVENEEKQLCYIKRQFKKLRYQRYEISNWAINKNYFSKHNLAYWNYEDWKAIGYGAVGLENFSSYEYLGNIQEFKKTAHTITKEEYYLNSLIMGLRKTNGLDLSIPRNQLAFNMYKNKLKNYKIINNRLYANNIDCLFDTIIDLF